MREKSYVAHLGVSALVLTLMATCPTGGALTKFVTKIESKAEATVAAWGFKTTRNNGAALSSIDTGRTTYKGETTGDNVTVPGTQGSFNIVLDGTDSDVDIDYTVTTGKPSEPDTPDSPDDLVSQVDSTDYSPGGEIEEKIEHAAGDDVIRGAVVVSQKWDYGSADIVEADRNDNKYVGKPWKLKIKATGTQTKSTGTTASTA